MGNGPMKTYSEKLRDARWQKKRLEVLQRDRFTCCGCASGLDCEDEGVELHVHHMKYAESGDPWDVPIGWLVTLCKECHEGVGQISDDDLSMIRNLKNASNEDGLYNLSDLLESAATENLGDGKRSGFQGIDGDVLCFPLYGKQEYRLVRALMCIERSSGFHDFQASGEFFLTLFFDYFESLKTRMRAVDLRKIGNLRKPALRPFCECSAAYDDEIPF